MIRRRVEIQPGQPLREANIVATQDRLYNLGIFNRVDIATRDPSGTVQNKDVLIETREGDRYTIGYGGGIEMQRLGSTTNATSTSLEVSPLGIFDFTKLNFAGRAQTLSFKARASTIQYRGLLSYQIPSVLTNPKFNLLVTGFADKSQDVNTSFTDMFVAIIAGLALMFMILVIAFNSFRHTWHLLVIVPLSLIGVLDGLALAGHLDDVADVAQPMDVLTKNDPHVVSRWVRRRQPVMLKGRRATTRARLTARVSARWCLAQFPEMRRGMIFPRSVMK